MRVAQYKGLDPGDDEDEDADPSYKQPSASSRKSRTNGHAFPSEDGGSSGDDEDDEGGVQAPSKQSKQHTPDDGDDFEDEEEDDPPPPKSATSTRDVKPLPKMNGNLDSTEDDESTVAIKPTLSIIATSPQAPALSPSRASVIKSPSRGRIPSGATEATPNAAVSPTSGPLVDKRPATPSAASSREASPAPSAKDSEDEEEEEEEEPRMSLAGVSRQRRASLLESAGVTGPDGDSLSKPSSTENDMDQDGDVDMAGDAEGAGDVNDDNEEDNGEGDQEGDVDVEGDGQGDGEPDDEDHDNDLESDLQPAHRAEALDVLAAIELRWALLRERVYVEKMESLGWEEELVKQGSS